MPESASFHGNIGEVWPRALAAALALAVTACLSTPGPGPADTDVDAPAGPRCRRDALPAGQAWPPAGVNIRAARLADVDGDGTGDLVVNATPADPQAAGISAVYVLYGPVDAAAPRYHAALDLDDDALDAELQPSALSLDDLDGDGCLDLTVAGPPTFSNVDPRVAVWRHGGGAEPWSGPARRASLDFPPQANGPVMILWADLALGADRDLVVADLGNINVLAASSLDGLGNAVRVPRPQPCDAWDSLNGLAAQPGPRGRERLLALGSFRLNTVDIDDAGMFEIGGGCTGPPIPLIRGTAPVDLDGTAPSDLVIGGGGWLGAVILTGAAPPDVPPDGARACTDTPRGTDDYIEGFAVGAMGGTAAPDAVIIDWDDAAGASFACLVNGLARDGDMILANGTDELQVTAARLSAVAVGDAGGGVRAWMFATAGALHCVKRTEGVNALEPC